MTASRDPLRFVLTGTFSSHNKGDAAMELCAAQELADAFEGCHVTIASPFPEIDGPFYRSIDVVRSRRRSLVRGTLNVGRAWAWRALRERTGVDVKLLLGRDAEARRMAEADLVIDLSGDMLTEDYGPHVAYSHFLPLLLAKALGCKVFVCAQSIGPFSATKPLARWVLDRADAVTIRDELTRHRLEEVGLVREPPLTADLAFLLHPSSSERADEILAAEGVPKSARLCGASVSQLCEKHYDKSHGSEQSFTRLFAHCLDSYVDEHDVDIVFVSHVTGPRAEHDDRIISDVVRAQMRHKARAHVLGGDYRPDELKAVISRCEVFVGCRMHANIAALSTGVPTIAIAYSHKAPGIMETFEQGRFALPIAELSEGMLDRALRDVAADEQQIRETLRIRIDEVKRESNRNFEIISDLVSRPRSDATRS